MYLTQAVIAQNGSANVQLSVLSNGLHEVNGDELLAPNKATLIGACKVIPQEYINFRTKTIDIDWLPGSTPQPALLAAVAQEIDSFDDEGTLAYRHGYRWVQGYDTVRLQASVAGSSTLQAGQTYLVSAGFVGIGMALSEYMMLERGCRLLLLEDGFVPARADWQQWLADHPNPQGQDKLLRRLLQKSIELEQRGAQLYVAGVDMGNLAQVQAAIAAGEAQLGPVRGVIHAMGAYAANRVAAVSQMTPQLAQYNFRTIAYGMYVLDQALAGHALDFRLSLGSIGSVLGGFGYLSYGAASSFMSAYAFATRQADAADNTRNTPWMVQAWDAWEIEWQVEEIDEQMAKMIGSVMERIMPVSLTLAEGLDCFERLLGAQGKQYLAVSASALQARIETWVKLKGENFSTSAASAGERHARPALDTPYLAPRNSVEQQLAEIWQDLLGLEQIGVKDDFYALGGTSLVVAQLMARIRDRMQVDLPLTLMFETPRIESLAAAYSAHQGAEQQLQTLLHNLEQMSEGEAQAALEASA